MSKQAPEHELSWEQWSMRDTIRRNPCKCDPPGSGEEWCTGHCYLQAEIDELKAAARAFIDAQEYPRRGYDAALAELRRLVQEGT